jgi:hypothetical protein
VLPVHAPDTSRATPADRGSGVTAPEVYPNPFISRISFRMPAGEKAIDVSLMDIWGCTVRHMRFHGNDDGMMELQGIVAGCYVLRIVTRKKVYLQRVVKR